jgi:hypothetical protein
MHPELVREHIQMAHDWILSSIVRKLSIKLLDFLDLKPAADRSHP